MSLIVQPDWYAPRRGDRFIDSHGRIGVIVFTLLGFALYRIEGS